jgi:hypothetical protein
MPLNSRKNPGNAPFFTKIALANQLLSKKRYLFSASLADGGCRGEEAIHRNGRDEGSEKSRYQAGSFLTTTSRL